MRPLGAVAGTGTAVLGMVAGVVGALLAEVVNGRFDGTMRPLAITFVAANLIAALAWRRARSAVPPVARAGWNSPASPTRRSLRSRSMANITKRANKRCADYLDGEVAELALLCEMKGGLGAAMAAAVVATRTTERVMRSATRDRLADEGGIARRFPASTAAVLITPTRFMAMACNGIRFHPPTLVLARDQVRADLIGRRGLGKRLEFRFSDASRAAVDVGAMQPLDEFVAALNGVPAG